MSCKPLSASKSTEVIIILFTVTQKGLSCLGPTGFTPEFNDLDHFWMYHVFVSHDDDSYMHVCLFFFSFFSKPYMHRFKQILTGGGFLFISLTTLLNYDYSPFETNHANFFMYDFQSVLIAMSLACCLDMCRTHSYQTYLFVLNL